jgi:hypothetical protein
MERKLELKDYAGNLDFGLCVQNQSASKPIWKVVLCDVKNGFNIENKIISSECLYKNSFNYKLVMRTLSDLYCTITHNGKEIVPIVELAKIAAPCYVWKINVKKAVREIKHKGWTDRVFFGYSGLDKNNSGSKKGRYFYSLYQCDNIEYPHDQVPLFDYLHELKIDYRGLIDAGLAVSVHDFKNNPYK